MGAVLEARVGVIVTLPSAVRVETMLRAQFPHADVIVERISGGLHIEVYGDASSLFAIVGDEPSAVIAALGPWQPE